MGLVKFKFIKTLHNLQSTSDHVSMDYVWHEPKMGIYPVFQCTLINCNEYIRFLYVCLEFTLIITRPINYLSVSIYTMTQNHLGHCTKSLTK